MNKAKKEKEDFLAAIKLTDQHCEWLQALMHEKLVDAYVEIGCTNGLTVHLPELPPRYFKHVMGSIRGVTANTHIASRSELTFSKVEANLKAYRESLP